MFWNVRYICLYFWVPDLVKMNPGAYNMFGLLMEQQGLYATAKEAFQRCFYPLQTLLQFKNPFYCQKLMSHIEFGSHFFIMDHNFDAF